MSEPAFVPPFIVYAYLNGHHENDSRKVECAGTLFPNARPDLVAVADGGMKFFLTAEPNLVLRPETLCWWIGDGDSTDPNQREDLAALRAHGVAFEETLLSPEKDFSDFARLLDLVRDYSSKLEVPICMVVCGGLGGRRDHESVNLHEAAEFLESLPLGGMCYFPPHVIVTNLQVAVSTSPSEVFSVVASQKRQEAGVKPSVTLANAKYSGKVTLVRPSHGLSNRAMGHHIEMNPHGEVMTIYLEGLLT